MTPKQKRQLLEKVKNENPRLYTEQEVKDLSEAYAQKVIISYLASSLITLRDTFGFSKKRLERFLKGQSSHAQAMKDNYVTANEILKQVKLETKFDLNEFVNEQVERK